MNRQKSLIRIAELLGRFTNEVKLLNAANLYDINIHAESVLIPLINEAYDLDLVNANFDQQKNFSAVDLIDNKNRIAFQVTSTAESDKIKHTLSQFVKHERYKDYDILFIYIISEKQTSYSGKGFEDIINKNFTFDKKENILDSQDLYAKTNSLVSLQKIRKIEELLEQEFTDAKIETRRQSLENPEAQLHEERIFPNILEANIPEYVYLADLNIDREAIIKKTWEGKYKLRMDASARKVLRRAMDFDEVTFFRDWYTAGNQVLTFRDLNSRTEKLTDYIDSGTVTRLECQEYWNTNEETARNFSALLRLTFQEKMFPKAIHFNDEEGLFRFNSNRKVIMARTVTWKKSKKATRTVLFEMLDKDKTKIVCFKHFAFYTNFSLFKDHWYLSINPTWSFTSDGYRKSGLSKFYSSGLKRLENNKTIYYAFLFVAYCINNMINEESDYPLLSFQDAKNEMISTKYELVDEDFDGDDLDTEIR